MPEYKDYELVGGQPVKISPFDAAAAGDGVHFAKEGRAFNPVIVSGGAFNPNYVETIEGTLANPWGNLDYQQLVEDYNNSACTVSLVVDAETIPASCGTNYLVFVFVDVIQSEFFSVRIEYDSAGVLNYARICQEVEPLIVADLPPESPCTLTIIHHPLPDTP